MKPALFLISLATLYILPGCSKLPGAKALSVSQSLSIPRDFDMTPIATPEIAKGLKSLFSDKELNKYISKALKSNPSLKLSLARLEEAGFNTRRTYATSVPSLTAAGSASRSTVGGSGFNFTGGQYNASLDSQWELDVWDRIRSGVTASRQSEGALAADYAAARESIAAQTMQAYFSLIASERLLDLSGRRLSSFEKTVSLVNRRFEAGIGNLSDVDLARTDVENAKAQVEQRKNNCDQAARRLAVLTGSYPKTSISASTWPSLRRGVPAGVPSQVMMNRPDIHAAYIRILAADSNVKVAHRDLYPRFTLTASGGQRSNQLKQLADSNFNIWSIAAGVTAPILDGGNRKAELGAANARAKQALANYQTATLNAFEEVENALGSETYLLRQERSYSSALEAAKSAETRTLQNYENGLVEILTLLDAQRRSFQTEEQLINTTALRYQNRVSLALALGKGL